MTNECHHISPVCLSLSDCRALTSIISSKKTAFHWQSDSTRQIIISVWVDCLVLQLFLPVTLQAQQHATFLIKFQMSFFPPLSPPFSFAEVVEIHIGTSIFLSLSSHRRPSERKQNSEEKREGEKHSGQEKRR